MPSDNQALHCFICGRNVGSSGWTDHVKSYKHVRLASQQNTSPHIEPGHKIANDADKLCELCDMNVKQSFWSRHVLTARHKQLEMRKETREMLEEAEKDKNGLHVEGDTDLGFVELHRAERGVKRELVVKSSNQSARAVLIRASFTSANGQDGRSGFSVAAAHFNRPISSGKSAIVEYTFQRYYLGRYQDRLELVFEDVTTRQKFIIAKVFRAIVGDKVEHEALKPATPYMPPVQSARQPETQVIQGIPPPASKAIRYVVVLPPAPIPSYLATILNGTQSMTQQLAQIRKLHLPKKLNCSTYSRHFKHLLWIEEQKMESDLSRYDMSDVTLSRFNNLFYLAIPGLAEKRPSVLVGDRILVQKKGSPYGHWFEGHVHVVRQLEVGLRFHGSFSGWSASQPYNVRFKLNRIVVRRQHQAMDADFSEERVLFPAQNHVKQIPSSRASSIRIFNPLIENNERQMQAVASIAYQPPGSTPFVVFGPPGTGKTITVVEAIRQVLRIHPGSRVLACAPSNSAADIIAERLAAGLSTDELFRMYAVSRSKNDVPDKLRDYVCTTGDEIFTAPIMARMKTFRVIVATCTASSMVAGIGMPRGHFSHIFVDEAAQATETEAFISIKTLANAATNIVLSGDPKQLGPVIRSGIGRRLGLETSYLERLMDRTAYDVKREHGVTVVKLTKNFRSHEAILKFPNDRFYAGDLEQCAKPAVINSYLDSAFLASPKFPVVFHSVSGKDDREASSPSFFNIDEVLQVKAYVQKLKADRQVRTTDNDIGVIAPYHAQCQKLRTALRSVAEGVKVGSVEEFQGQERRVIIISTVRSSQEFIEYDLRHTLGFVANPRRFNVAVTRAQALLIVVGDPNVLGLDPLWRSFLNYVHRNNGWIGPDIPWDPAIPVEEVARYDVAVRKAAEMDMNALARRIEEVTLGKVEDPDANVDRPWRDME